jgi:phosphoglycolate phosphatase
MNYKHIVWDWNGTLLDDAMACTRAVSEMMEKRQMSPLTLAEYRAKIGFPVINLYYTSGFDLDKENYEDICEEYITNYISNYNLIKIQDDASEVLSKFSRDGLTQHIVSASGYNILIQQIEGYKLRPFFTHVLGQKDNQGDSKVHLAKQLLELLDCDPREVLFIGDTIHDFEVANEAGFDCRLVANGHCNRERLEETGVPVHSDLLSLYKSL